jgi:hypothetical protein
MPDKDAMLSIGNSNSEQQDIDKSPLKFEDYYVVKIAGKGNIPRGEPRHNTLHENLHKTFRDITDSINEYNKKKKPVLIMWDGDNYQGLSHDKPSPFTDLIKMFGQHAATLVALKNKEEKDPGPWKIKHLLTWDNVEFKKLFIDQEPHEIVNKLCDMYVSYGATLFAFRNDKEADGQTTGYKQVYEFFDLHKPKLILQKPELGLQIFVKPTRHDYHSGGKKSRKSRKSRKGRKSRKSRKSRKGRKGRKGRKSRKR